MFDTMKQMESVTIMRKQWNDSVYLYYRALW